MGSPLPILRTFSTHKVLHKLFVPKIIVPRVGRSTIGGRGFSYRAPLLRNYLPIEIIWAASLSRIIWAPPLSLVMLKVTSCWSGSFSLATVALGLLWGGLRPLCKAALYRNKIELNWIFIVFFNNTIRRHKFPSSAHQCQLHPQFVQHHQ